jgi:hypothetical protein
MIAKLMPKLNLSMISDGMQQTHCVLPWLSNLSSIGKGLSQHIQGVLMHGRIVLLCRTFHTVPNGGNLQIHTFLLSLQHIISTEGNQIKSFCLRIVT